MLWILVSANNLLLRLLARGLHKLLRMAPETEGLDREDGIDNKPPQDSSNGKLQPEQDEEEEEEEEDDEPRLKYAVLTKSLKPVYRNGDSTSTFLVAGDKMVRRAGLG